MTFKLGYRPELDGLRAIAVGSVMLGHSSLLARGADLMSPGASMPCLLKGGLFGVDIFFVLSGFLITTLLLQEKQRFGRIDFKAFYIRRILRLSPAMFLTLAGCALYIIFFRPPQSEFDFVAIGLSALYISNFVLIFAGVRLGMLTPTWSLSVEEQFYSLWPLTLSFLLRLSRERVFKIVLIAAISAALLRAAAYSGYLIARSHEAPELAMNFFGFGAHFLLARADSLLCGALVAMAACWGWLPTWSGESRFWTNLTWGAAIILAFMLLLGPDEAPPALYYTYTCAAIVPALLIAGLVTSPPIALLKILTLPPLVWIGRISYGLYLYHVPIYVSAPWPALSFLPPAVAAYATYALAVVVTIVIAAASFYFIERRFLELKHRIGVPRLARPPSPAQRERSPATVE